MKKLFSQLTIKAKLNLILTVSVLALLFSQAINLNELWYDLNENKKSQLKQITQVAHSIIAKQDKLVKNGSQSIEQAQANAKELIAGLTYGQGEYFFIVDNQYTMVMHPIKSSLNGANVKAMKDSNGTPFFNTMINNTIKDGESFVDYVWPRPGQSESVSKLSYSKYYSDWGWAVATGVYTDDLVETFKEEIWIASRSTIVVILVTFLVVFYASDSIISPIISLEKKMMTVANNKDLTIRSNLQGKDELADMGKAFNSMLTSFHDILCNMSLASEQISCSSTQLSSTTQQTLVGMEGQKAETHQVASAMTEMSATVHEVAMNISEAALASHGAAKATEKGRTVVSASRTSIEELGNKLNQAEILIHTLEDQSDNISSILSVITGIAEQTNLLALNAAIEAARAGEQGRGFAVVADEVRNLSSRTHESTSEINEVITNLQQGSQAAVQAMAESKLAANVVVDHAAKTEDILLEITNAVAQIDTMTSQIASASEQQTVVAEEININITNISNISEESAVGGEQTARSSEDLAKLSLDMKGIVQQFKVIEA